MRRVLLLILILLVGVAPARAQSSSQPSATHRAVKVLIGASALAIGVVVAAKSSETTTVTSLIGRSETSTFSSSQLITGLAIAGTGGVLLWDGLRDRTPHPTLRMGVKVANGGGVRLVRRSW